MAGEPSNRPNKPRYRKPRGNPRPQMSQPTLVSSSDDESLQTVVKNVKRKVSVTGSGSTAPPAKKSKVQLQSDNVSIDVVEDDFLNIRSEKLFRKLNFNRRVSHGYHYILETFLTLSLMSFLKPWLPIVVNRENTFPTLVRLFFSNLSIKENGDIHSMVRGVKIVLNPEIIANIFTIPRTYVLEYPFPKYPLDSSLPISYTEVKKIVMEGEVVEGNILPSRTLVLSKILLHIINSNVLPNSGHFQHEPVWNLHAAARLIQLQPVDLPSYMCHVVKEVFLQKKRTESNKSNLHLPFGNMFTTIFKHFEVDVSVETNFVETKKYDMTDFRNTNWAFDEATNAYYHLFKNRVCRYIDGAPVSAPNAHVIPGTPAYEALKKLSHDVHPPAMDKGKSKVGEPGVVPSVLMSETPPVQPSSASDLAAVMSKLCAVQDEVKVVKTLVQTSAPSVAVSASSASPSTLESLGIMRAVEELKVSIGKLSLGDSSTPSTATVSESSKAVVDKLEEVRRAIDERLPDALESNHKQTVLAVKGELDGFYDILFKQTDYTEELFKRVRNDIETEIARRRLWEETLNTKLEESKMIVVSNMVGLKDVLVSARDAMIGLYAKKESGAVNAPWFSSKAAPQEIPQSARKKTPAKASTSHTPPSRTAPVDPQTVDSDTDTD